MTVFVVVMVLTVLVAFVVITVFSQDDDDWTTNRPGRADPGRTALEDLLDP